MKRKLYARELRQEVLAKIQAGRKVAAAAAECGIKEATVRNWLSRETGGIKDLYMTHPKALIM